MKSLIFILMVVNGICGVTRQDPEVLSPNGVFRGVQGDGDYAMYLGIPYAVVDERNPFGAATLHPGFNGTYEANVDGVVCPQFTNNVAMGNIQCLQLNVYVPNTASSTNTKPVMVYFYGGSFVRGNKGTENFSPKFLIRNDVVIVAINYRVGPYGFLCLSEPGFNNQGMKDQVLGLKWVKENIEAFGGDVNTITAFGQSAGAMTLDILLLASEGLVHRAIIQSGPALNTWVIATRNDTIPIIIAEKLGFKSDNVKAVMEYLSTKDPIEIINTANDLQIMDSGGHPFTKPCVETVGDDALLTDFPVNIQPKVKGMDLMIGHTNKEVMFLYPDSNKEYYENYKFGDELSQAFDSVYDEDIVRTFYIGDQTLSFDLKSDILDYGSDFVFCYPADRTVDRYLDAGANSVYRYMFSYEGGRNRNKILNNLTSEGACHGDDLGYLFDMLMFEDMTTNDEDQRMIDVMTTMWTNFAKYGNPTPETTDLITELWQPANATHRPFLNIDNPIRLQNRVFNRRMAFWDLYYKMYKNNERGFSNNSCKLSSTLLSIILLSLTGIFSLLS